MRLWPPRESNEWTIEEAEQHFDEVFDRAFQDGPQLLIDDGVPVAYLVSKEDWRRKQAGLALLHEDEEAG
jgi:prevent-host-death family protein